MLRVRHLVMPLDAENVSLRIHHRRVDAIFRTCSADKSRRKLTHFVAMRHPDRPLLRKSFKQIIFLFAFFFFRSLHQRRSIFLNLRSSHSAAKRMRQPLMPVAKSQNRNTKIKNLRIRLRTPLVVHALWPTRENDASNSP